MKKLISIILALTLLTGILSACTANEKPVSDKISIVTTIFPEYDWVMEVLGSKAENADVTMLLDDGVDLHSYQPTADDMIKISSCDLFIYVGGESDEWVEDALTEATNKDMLVINLLDTLGDAVKEEEIVEAMEAEEKEADEAEKEEIEYDEHVWLSLKNSAVLVSAIRDALVEFDPENADTYNANAEVYIEKLNKLDSEYKSTVDSASVKTVLFGDRFPFRYLVDDYGLDYYAAFVGCSAETEASFETIAFLANKLYELKLSAVLTLEGTDHRIAETVISTSGAQGVQILSMDSMQSTTSKDVKDGASYISIMESNLSVLKDALK